MQKAKKGRFVYPRRLLQNEDVLPLLEKYADDPHPNVQDVLFLAADTYHTPAALQLHTALIERRHEQSIGNAFTYSPKEIREWGGPRLRSALLSYLRLDTNGMEGINSARALLMIGSFGPSVEVEAYLQDLRAHRLTYTLPQNYQGTIRTVTIEKRSPPFSGSEGVDLALPVDIALSEQGDQPATDRVIIDIDHGDVDGTLLFVLHATRFIHQRQILLRELDLLNDRRLTQVRCDDTPEPDRAASSPAQTVSPSATGPVYARVCDLALLALVHNTQAEVGIPDLMAARRQNRLLAASLRTERGNYVEDMRRFSDSELSLAYEQIKVSILTSKKA